eukprot:SAG11_NODE_101_length_16738_cov_8.254703_16_plen_78_part_00
MAMLAKNCFDWLLVQGGLFAVPLPWCARGLCKSQRDFPQFVCLSKTWDSLCPTLKSLHFLLPGYGKALISCTAMTEY